MIKKIKSLFKIKKNLKKDYLNQLKELEWAHIYHDSIRGYEFIEKLPLNIGRWAGNYAFFYVLNRVLRDFKPIKILELGLGESSKLISTYIENYLLESEHLIVEQDKNWSERFQNIYQLSPKSKIIICPLRINIIKGFKVNSYANFENSITKKYDLYIVDGPFGSPHFSRYDIINLVKNFNEKDEFVIIIDDFERIGEQETTNDLLILLQSKNIKFYESSYIGNKTVKIIATEKYKFTSSL